MKKVRVKRIIIALLLFVIWIGILVYITDSEKIRIQKKNAQYVLIDQFNYWKYVDSEWVKLDSVNDFDSVAEEINWKKYDIYINNKYFNTLEYVLMEGQEYYFDDNDHSHEINQEKILFNNDTYLQLKEFNLIDFSNEDINIVKKILNKYSHSFDDVTIKNKYMIDDNNSIYIISNYTNLSSKYNSDLFYLAFYRRNSKNYLLMNIGNEANVSDYKLAWVLDEKNKYDNFILSYTCEDTICYDMYEYKNGKYVKIIST